jgi:hypothetical protein
LKIVVLIRPLASTVPNFAGMITFGDGGSPSPSHGFVKAASSAVVLNVP